MGWVVDVVPTYNRATNEGPGGRTGYTPESMQVLESVGYSGDEVTCCDEYWPTELIGTVEPRRGRTVWATKEEALNEATAIINYGLVKG